MLAIAKSLNLRQSYVAARLDYANIVADAGKIVGWERAVAMARWRESSGFAHGRQWAAVRLCAPQSAQRIRGGVIVAVGLAEEHHRKVAALATALLERALTDWAKAAAPEGPSPPSAV